ncbi:MAG: 50S ribosomal protein L3 [Reinekea forsetii]|jgi:large subunit ribosomal protein L3|uniref:Large ribosomal subunit protein uL3 n=1 Tax=Reinekea forsetii TaxID=1336806 RepID=A0A2K8KKL0_9GAMM|nr:MULTISPECIES: 50S ribosomal protein L3 [Reinekea]ATX75513.1 LSU ribosomal protein L3p (L3e) [Reinekea forsetii]MDO7641722.1 50S ribosomal protein L3 [Reinekea forsetii]MDO7645405.1 50S ribosomal protein L3 [Reinekea forsetii]MDO7675206.1 50S ribosomal protein L3 [Reinekea forsetii]
MSIGLIGRKAGMTRVFTEEGSSIPVTVVEVKPNRISQIKSVEVDGYVALQLTAGTKRTNQISKAEAGHFAKSNVEMGVLTREFTVADASEYEAGKELTVELFTAGQKVDVTGTSKGKGFAGAIKRHNFSMQDATHGNSLSHRAPGSIGQCQTPGRVWKGKKMAGHMGAERSTTQSLEVVRVDVERNLLLIKGAVPGATGSHVFVQPAVKS